MQLFLLTSCSVFIYTFLLSPFFSLSLSRLLAINIIHIFDGYSEKDYVANEYNETKKNKFKRLFSM